jgi:hypothetical protein
MPKLKLTKYEPTDVPRERPPCNEQSVICPMTSPEEMLFDSEAEAVAYTNAWIQAQQMTPPKDLN